MNRPETIRAFVSLNVPAEIRGRAAGVQRELQPVAGDAVRWVAPGQIHLTLKFLGAIASASVPELEAALGRAGAGATPFALRLGAVGGFPDLRQPRVLWIGLEGNLGALQRAQECVRRETVEWGRAEEREFHPHLTLGRIPAARPGGCRDLAARAESIPSQPDVSWRVTELHLMRSELSAGGSRYTSLAAFPLGAAHE